MKDIKRKIDDLEFVKLETVLGKKVNNLKNKIPDATTFIQVNQYNTDKHNFEKKSWRCW